MNRIGTTQLSPCLASAAIYAIFVGYIKNPQAPKAIINIGQNKSQFRPGRMFRFASRANNPININIAAQIGYPLLSEAFSLTTFDKFATSV
jgi:hypothetical protein